ncbi:MAG: hypothetical protein ACTHK2_00875 [Dokdonella sp.]|uniref:hypothetical protein n=1 Tax=Dokdonella sp. TaxID=2291710 RepID=UPI003F7CF8D3
MRHCPSILVAALAVLLSSAFASPCRAAAGDLDPSFGTDGVGLFTPDGAAVHEMASHAVLTLADGRILVGGSRNYVQPGSPDPRQRPTLVRFSRDGALDTQFGNQPANPGLLELPAVADTGMQQVEAMVQLVDGSIIVAGTNFAFGPLTGFVMKVDADGRLDSGFGSAGIATFPQTQLHAMAADVLATSTRIVVAGERVDATGISRAVVIRMDAEGARDRGFGPLADGEYVFEPRAEGDQGYIHALAVDRASRIVVAGSYAAASGAAIDFSVARLLDRGSLDPEFAAGGWRTFRGPDATSDFNEIGQLLILPNRRMVFAAHHRLASGGTGILLGGLDEAGATDTAFGAPSTPGYSVLDVAPDAVYRNPTGLVRQLDGKLLVGVAYSVDASAPDPRRPEFTVARTTPSGEPDTGFGDDGVAHFDLAPNGDYSLSTALALQDGQPLVAGAAWRQHGMRLVDLALVRLQGETSTGVDAIFASGFEAPAMPLVITYDDVPEGAQGASWTDAGVSYHDVNGVDVVFPDGSAATADDLGDQLIVERAPAFYTFFPGWGSAPNALTFGGAYMAGDNFSLGPLARVTMDLDEVMSDAGMDIAYYENGPWGGIVLHLDAYRQGTLAASDTLTISDASPGRDNPAVARLSITGASFDQLKLHATYEGQASAPRVMIDNLALRPAARSAGRP